MRRPARKQEPNVVSVDLVLRGHCLELLDVCACAQAGRLDNATELQHDPNPFLFFFYLETPGHSVMYIYFSYSFFLFFIVFYENLALNS
jgi:hypothetical protein